MMMRLVTIRRLVRYLVHTERLLITRQEKGNASTGWLCVKPHRIRRVAHDRPVERICPARSISIAHSFHLPCSLPLPPYVTIKSDFMP